MSVLASIRVRSSASALAVATLLALTPGSVQAQGFAGTGTVDLGSATIDATTPGVTTISVPNTSPRTTITWTPTDANSGGGPIDFLPNGNIVNYVGAAGESQPYTVLNRIIPVDPSRSIAFNGTVNSASNVRVFFYSPGGLLIGSTARFNVGGLLLSTSDLIVDGQNDFMPTFNQFSVAGAAGSQSAIEIQTGAEIRAEAIGQSNFVVAVAPRIQQDGLISVRGSAALVAAESADFAVDNQGLFNITVNQGSEVSTDAFSHTGSTGGPDATGFSGFQRVYMVAVPKNNAITMAIQSGGSIGFDVAGAASLDGNTIVLSAGHNIADTGIGDPIVGTPAGSGPANIVVQRGSYTSNTIVQSAGDAIVADTIVGGTPNISFASDLSVQAAGIAAVRADQGTVSITGDVTVRADAPTNGNAGFALLAAGGAGTSLTASSAFVSAVNDATTGPAAIGGNAEVQSAGGSITIAGDLSIDAYADGTSGGAATNATGGRASIRMNGGFLSVAGSSALQASGIGGTGAGPGGDARGGTVEIVANSNAVVTLEGDVNLINRALGGNTGAAYGGSAIAGATVVRSEGSDVALGSVSGNVTILTSTVAGVGDLPGKIIVRNVLIETNPVGRVALGGATTGSAGDVTVATGASVSALSGPLAEPLRLTLSAASNVVIGSSIANTPDGASLVLRADNQGSSNGTVIFGGGNTIGLFGANSTIDIYHNPASFGTPTDYSANITNGQLTTYQLVNSLTDLQAINNFATQNFALNRNLDAKETAAWNSGAGFMPIGSGSNFSGNFDGLGYSISNLTINRPGENDVGLFAGLAGPAFQPGIKVRNLSVLGATITGGFGTGIIAGGTGNCGFCGSVTLDNIFVSGTVNGTGNVGGLLGGSGTTTIVRNSGSAADIVGTGNRIGGLIGGAYQANVTQSFATGSVTGGANSEDVGGLIGWHDYGSLTDVYASGNVSAGAGAKYVGGLTGTNWVSVTRAYATGNVTVGSGGDAVGGLVGQNLGPGYGTIGQSYSSGAVSVMSGTNIGGLVGNNAGGVILDSYWDSFSSGPATAFGADTGTITNLNAVTSDPGQFGAPNYALGMGAYANFNASDWRSIAGQTRPILAWEAPLTEGGVTLINSAHQLGFVNSNLSGTYRLTQDINASEMGRVGGIWGSAGFIPIGTDELGNASGAGFTGNVDGANHTIRNLTINRTNSNVGLFGYANGATISNIVLKGGQVTGFYGTGSLVGTAENSVVTNAHTSVAVNSNGGNVGGLVGTNSPGSIVQDSSSSSAVNNIGGTYSTGGLVGYNGGIVRRSWATGSVNLDGSVDGAGGLVGFSDGFIDQSYSTATVYGGPGILGVGGLVGTIRNGSVTRSYATGAVTGTLYVGGFVGEIRGGGSASENYATGLVNGAIDVGGFVGHNEGAVTNGYWDSFSTGQVLGVGVDFGFIDQLNEVTSDPAQTGAANYALKASAYGNFDLNTTWRIYDGFTTPLLRNFLKPLAVSFADKTVVYDTNIPSLTLNMNDVDPVHVFGTATPIGAGRNVGTYSITVGSSLFSDQQGYDFTPGAPATLTITPAPLSVVADAATRIYGDANPAFTYTVTGLLGADTLSGALESTATNLSNVGLTAITQGTLSNANYAITYTSANLTINPRLVAVVADVASRIYGDANPAFTYTATGLVNGDTMTGSLSSLANATSNVGFFAIDQGTLSASANYVLNYTGANLAITARPITVTGDILTRIYGDANPALTFGVGGSGLVNGDTLVGTLATTAVGTSNVGAYAVTQGTLLASNNYTVTYVDGSLSITPRALSVVADAAGRIYGDANPAFTYTATGLVNGDTLTGALDSAANAASNVGAYTINQGTVAASSNYSLVYTSANLAVTPRALSVIADAANRVYGDANPAFSYSVLGLVNGDILTGSLDSLATMASNVGAYGINQGTLAASPNYLVSYTAGTLNIFARPLTVMGDALSRIYGDANPSFTYSTNGLVNGDTLSGTLGSAATVTSNVGSYALTQGTLGAGTNYIVTYVNGSLSITPRALSVIADAASRIYGDANPAFTYATTGLVNGDALTGQLASLANGTSNVGIFAVDQGTLSASANYQMTYTGANLTVTARPILVTGDALSRAYGDVNPALTFSVGGSGLINGDVLTGSLVTGANGTSNVGGYAVTQGSLAASSNYVMTYVNGTLNVIPRALFVTGDTLSRTYGDANPALTYTVAGLVNGDIVTGSLATTASVTSNVGAYAVTQGALSASPNYALNYSNGTLNISPRALSVVADAASRIYGDANPVFTYTAIGLVNGDVLNGTLGSAANVTSNVGAYVINQDGLAASSNYVLSYTGASLSVTPRALTVTANAAARFYGDANPSLTYTSVGLVNGDAISGSLSTTATASSAVGPYVIGQGTVAASSNYNLNFTSETLTVTVRPLTVIANAQSRPFGDPNAALTYRVTGGGLVNGDTLVGDLATVAASSSPIGVYAIEQGTVAASLNYAVTFVGANLTITACISGPACAPPPVVMQVATKIGGDIRQQQEASAAGEAVRDAASKVDTSDPEVLINSVINTSSVNQLAQIREPVAGAGNTTLWSPGEPE
jgi:filamentous hemagglutinin family protein